MTQHIVCYIQPFRQTEERLLVAAIRHSDDQGIENTRCTSHEVFVTARDRVERSGINGYNHGASPLLILLLVCLSLQIGPLPASTRPENSSDTPSPAKPATSTTCIKPRPQSAAHCPAGIWERALFLIFAPQQMIADRASLAFAGNRPSRQRRRLREIDRLTRFDVQRAARRHQRHGQFNSALEHGGVSKRWIEEHDIEGIRREACNEP